MGSTDVLTNEIRLEIVPNRSGVEKNKFYIKYIQDQTECLTDDHRSYYQAVEAIYKEHFCCKL